VPVAIGTCPGFTLFTRDLSILLGHSDPRKLTRSARPSWRWRLRGQPCRSRDNWSGSADGTRGQPVPKEAVEVHCRDPRPNACGGSQGAPEPWADEGAGDCSAMRTESIN